MIAPIAPTDADSVGVAKPSRMLPSTATISRSGGTSAEKTRRGSPLLCSSVICKAGTVSGWKIALYVIHTR